MSETEATAAARERMHTIINEYIPASTALLKALTDVLLGHAEALAREAAAAQSPESKSGLYNRKEVGRMLSCSVGTVDNLWNRGELKFTRRWLGGPRCSTWEQYNEYIERLNERGKE